MDLTNKTKDELLKIAEAVTALQQKQKYNLLDFVFPEKGKYSRDKYAKQMEFFRQGVKHRFRLFIGANGTGKSFNGSLELVYHTTGLYPKWWEGRIQDTPKTWWVICESGQLWRDSLQKILFGNPGEEIGTGLIPKECIASANSMPGIPGAIGSAIIKHVKGHKVSLIVKTFEMRRENLQAASIDGVVFDEEPPLDVYTESIMRLRGTPTKLPGISLLLFTPLQGLSEVVLKYLPQGKFPQDGIIEDEPEKYICRVEWDDVPHLTEEDKKAMLAEMEPHQRLARSKGIPALGSGKIYPVFEEDVIVQPFKIPDYWPRAFGLDFGWHKTACIWGAQDPHTKIIYLYAEYYRGHEAVYVHANAIKAKGEWIPGICDPSGGGRQGDGSLLVDQFRAYGLDLEEGENAIVPGIARNLNMFESGQLKIFSTLVNTTDELRIYRYDTKDPNAPARNQADHLMDAIKYLTSRFEDCARCEDDLKPKHDSSTKHTRDKLTGY